MSALHVRIAFNNTIQFICRRSFSCPSVTEENEYNKISPLIDSLDENVGVLCNKSGLLQQHRNMLYEQRPYREPTSWIHQTEKYQRKVFARYGSLSGVDSRICFQKNSDRTLKNLYLKIVEPQTLQSMIVKSRLENERKVEAFRKREEDIGKNMEKLEQWKKELRNRSLKKEADALASKQRKERLVEEVRRHFGYKVDPRDERFKEVLEQKEREDKKKQRDAKRQAKEEKMMSKLINSV